MIPPSASSIHIPSLLRIDGPPGSGKTRMLAREACRFSREASTNAPVLLLALTGFNARRLQTMIRMGKGVLALPGAPIRILQWDDWLFSLLKNFLASTNPSSKLELLNDHEASVLLHEILQEESVQDKKQDKKQLESVGQFPSNAFFYASRHPSLARSLWEVFREWQVYGQTPIDIFTDPAEGLSLKDPSDATREFIQRVYTRFCEKTTGASLYCRSDLINQVLLRLAQNPQWAESLQGRYSALLVDEAQELSYAHHTLFAALQNPLVFAGNAALSVRSYRGAQPALFEEVSLYRQAGFSIKETSLEPADREAKMGSLAPVIAEDPAKEALMVAEAIQRFVQNEMVQDEQCGQRAARWEDCAVLLRSARFKSELTIALRSLKIPFQNQGLSDTLMGLQHRVLDFFRILLAWEADALPTEIADDPARLKATLVSRLPIDTTSGDATPDESKVPDWKAPLDRWLEIDTSDYLRWLGSAYARYQASGEWLPLWDELIEQLLAGDLFVDSRREAIEHDPIEEEARQALGSLQSQLLRLDMLYRKAFHRPFSMQAALAHAPLLWKEAGLHLDMDNQPSTETESDNESSSHRGVHLLSLHQAQGEAFSFVSIPFLVNGEFPRDVPSPELFPQLAQQKPDQEALQSAARQAEERRLLTMGMTRATHQLLLSAHRYHAGKPAEPSPWVDWHNVPIDSLASVSSLPDISLQNSTINYYEEADLRVLSAWAALEQQLPQETVLAPEETISLSASSIKAFMTCPRQYYYRNLLFLPQESGASAILGSLTHRVFEVFNQSAQAGNYTVTRLKELINIMTASDEDPDVFNAAGFSEKDARQLAGLGPMGLWSFRERLLASADDLERKGYFRRYARLRRVEAEKKFRDVAVAGLSKRCRLQGSIDALIETEDGQGWDVLDYKTSNSAYGIGVSGCEKRFLEGMLIPLPDDPKLSSLERFAGRLNTSYPADYQLPLYFLALRQDADYRNHLQSLAIQMVRPVFPGKEEQGAIRLEVAVEALAAIEERLVEELRDFVVDPILSDNVFKPTPSQSACDYCAYLGICDAAAVGDDAEESDS